MTKYLGEDEWHRHSELLGRVTSAWNHNVYQLLRVFEHLTGLPEPTLRAIFFSHRSDKAQRELIAAVAEAVEVRENERLTLKKLLNRLDKAATKRNLAAHTIFGLRQGWANGAWGAQVVPALGPEHDERLDADFAAQFAQVERELKAIFQALEDWLVHTPFPDRPWGHPPFPGRVSVSFVPDNEPATWP
jgi:hypothetical protein